MSHTSGSMHIDDGDPPVLVVTLSEESVRESGFSTVVTDLFGHFDAGIRNVIVDLSRLPIVDSGAIGLAVTVGQRISGRGQFALIGDVKLREILEIARLGTLIPVFPDAETALRSIRGDGVGDDR